MNILTELEDLLSKTKIESAATKQESVISELLRLELDILKEIKCTLENKTKKNDNSRIKQRC